MQGVDLAFAQSLAQVELKQPLFFSQEVII
jgi:hypothetical protein